MLKIILACMLMFFILQSIAADDVVPDGARVRKVVEARIAEAEAAFQREMADIEAHRQQALLEEQQREAEKLRVREAARPSAVHDAAERCAFFHDQVDAFVRDIVNEMYAGNDMRRTFDGATPEIGYCAMRALMDASFSVTYVPRNDEMQVLLDRDVAESRIEMETSPMCSGSTVIYGIKCGKREDDCALFYAEYVACMKKDDVFESFCGDAHAYSGMVEVARYPTFTMCL